MSTSGSDDALALRELKYAYVRHLDTKSWDDLAGLFTDSATASYGGGAYRCEGRQEIMSFLVRTMGNESMHTAHRVSQPEFDIGGDVARARWALDDTVIDQHLGVFISGAAFYEDRYVHTGGRWLTDSTSYRRLFEYLVPLSDMPHFSLTASWWGTDGRSTLPAG